MKYNNIDINNIKVLYLQGNSIEQIAKIMHTSYTVIRSRMLENGIERRKKKIFENKEQAYKSLYELYISQRLSIAKIGRLYNATQQSIAYWLEKVGIEVRHPIIDEWQLRRLYLKERKSLHKIEKETGISCTTIANRLRELNIPIRSRGDSLRQYICNDNFFSIPNELNSYWAGFVAADFYIKEYKDGGRLSCSLSLKDKDQLVRFCRDIKLNKEVKVRSRMRKNTLLHTCEIELASKQVIIDLKNNFNIESVNKTKRLEHPINLDRKNTLAFIVGYIDGDGWVGYPKKYKNGGSRQTLLGVCGTQAMVSWIKDKLDIELLSAELPISSEIRHQRNDLYSWTTYSCSAYLISLLNSVPVEKMNRKLPQIEKYDITCEKIYRVKLK